jgi:hypothetical protein
MHTCMCSSISSPSSSGWALDVADGNTGGVLQTPEEIEDEELVHWASLKEHQERFVRSNGFW